MKISYVSDLHLEFGDYPSFSKEEGGDVLILAGDIVTAPSILPQRNDPHGRGLKKYLSGPFKKDLLDKYSEIYMVMGNHEHYNFYFNLTANNLKQSFRELGLPIYLLDNAYVVLDDVTFIGSTLWSDFEKGNPNSMSCCEWGMNDFRIIGINENSRHSMTAEFALVEHNKSVQYIREILNINGNEKTVVITHHGPTYKSLNKEHIGNGMDGAYASDLSDLILGYPQIKYWISGHSHIISEYQVGDYTTVVANCRGYRGETSYRQFQGLKHIEV